MPRTSTCSASTLVRRDLRRSGAGRGSPSIHPSVGGTTDLQASLTSLVSEAESPFSRYGKGLSAARWRSWQPAHLSGLPERQAHSRGLASAFELCRGAGCHLSPGYPGSACCSRDVAAIQAQEKAAVG